MDYELWERQKSDTKKSYEAFHVYLTIGRKRSLKKVSEELSKDISLIKRWSERHNWVSRVSAHDAYLETIDRKDYENNRLASRKKRQKIVQGLEVLLGRIVDKDLTGLDPQAVNQLAGAASKILDQSRQEFNDLPTQRAQTELMGKGGAAIQLEDTTLDDAKRRERITHLFDNARTRRDGESS
jgi:hypothetical protein